MSYAFALSDSFLEPYKTKRVDFGFNGLGEVVYNRTYSRILPDGSNERWWQTIQRVVDGTFNLLKKSVTSLQGMNIKNEAEIMYDLMFNMKFLPPGRGLWAMGSPITEKRNLFAALNNCGFVSTKNFFSDAAEPFCFVMDACMLGVGMGFDTKGADVNHSTSIPLITSPNPLYSYSYHISDDREGWVNSLQSLLKSHFNAGAAYVKFNYSEIRPAGLPLKGFGGVSSGSGCLESLHTSIRMVLDELNNQHMTSTCIVDIMNLIGKCVIAGNVRRTAEIAFGEVYDKEFMKLKDYELNPHRASYGWTSNNSMFCNAGYDYKEIAESICLNGEPGIAWLNNMRSYSRMGHDRDFKDTLVAGGNPCLEQSLESYELCCLVETFPARHNNIDEFMHTLDSALLYAKIVTLGKTHWDKTNEVMERNRRIGCSISGVAQFLSKHSMNTLGRWLNMGYHILKARDRYLSNLFGIPKSIKLTSVKPSGTVSLLAGATPGMHYPESRYYIRRMRIATTSPLLPSLIEAGYGVEPAKYDGDTEVVSFPIDVGDIRTVDTVSMWEQLALAAFLQHHWADNQVSCTVTFNPLTEGPHIANALSCYDKQLKGVSFLPRLEAGAYEQMPYEAITATEFIRLNSAIGSIDTPIESHNEAEQERNLYCDNSSCTVD